MFKIIDKDGNVFFEGNEIDTAKYRLKNVVGVDIFSMYIQGDNGEYFEAGFDGGYFLNQVSMCS